MRFSAFFLSLALVFAASVAPQTASAEGPPKVINVIMVDTGGDTEKFLGFFNRARAISGKYGGTGTQRAWLSTYSGTSTGRVAVGVEYPSLVSMAESQAKVNPTPEWQKFIDDFEKAGMKVISNSVSVEITP